MSKEQLVGKISEKLGVSSTEKDLAYEVFLNSIVDIIEHDEALKVDGIGIFQLKRKSGSTAGSGKGDTLIYTPATEEFSQESDSLFLSIDVTGKKKQSFEFSDELFSIGVGKPLIPLSENDSFENDSDISYFLLKKSIQERTNEIVGDSERLGNFDLVNDFLKGIEPEAGELVEEEPAVVLEEVVEAAEEEIIDEVVKESSDDINDQLDNEVEDTVADEIIETEDIDVSESLEPVDSSEEIVMDEPESELDDIKIDEEDSALLDIDLDSEEPANVMSDSEELLDEAELVPDPFADAEVMEPVEETSELLEDDFMEEINLLDDPDEVKPVEIDIEGLSEDTDDETLNAEDLLNEELNLDEEKDESVEIDPLDADLAAIRAMAEEQGIEEVLEVEEDSFEEDQESSDNSLLEDADDELELPEEILESGENIVAMEEELSIEDLPLTSETDDILVDEAGMLLDEFDLDADDEHEENSELEDWDWGDELKKELTEEEIGETEETLEDVNENTTADNAVEETPELEEVAEEELKKEQTLAAEAKIEEVSKETKEDSGSKKKWRIPFLDKINIGFGKVFWILVASFVLVTAGGVYLILFTGSDADEHSLAVVDSTAVHGEEITEHPKKEETHHDDKHADSKGARVTTINGKKVIIDPHFKEEKAEDTKHADAEKTDHGEVKKESDKVTHDAKIDTKHEVEKPKKKVSKPVGPVKYRLDREEKEIAQFIYHGKDDYSVQVASFKRQTTAEKEANRLIKNGHDAFIVKALLQTLGTWYRVRIGGFKSKDEAIEFQKSYK
ncbi:MAG: SPOR domain-containing protein [Melioribacteraceae bacterium]|nr:SPOR domain-containing protein [Melioribacteraceae bacterium]